MSYESELAYHKAWTEAFDPGADPAQLALAGGQLADRMAWVFAAGYQAVMRDTFPALSGPAWSAFCVSEGRGDRPPLTGQAGGTINGAKTWVASASVVNRLVVKVGRGAAAFYRLAELPTDGVSLTWPDESDGFLGEMRQGIATFDGVRDDDLLPVDLARIANFGLREALYIYLAFVGHCAAQAPAGLAGSLADWLRADDHGAGALARLLDLDREVQALAAQELPVPAWSRDRRLVTMYSPMISKRVAAG